MSAINGEDEEDDEDPRPGGGGGKPLQASTVKKKGFISFSKVTSTDNNQ